MACQNCKSARVAELYAKCNDLCGIVLGNNNYDGYVPDGIGLGDDSDAVVMNYCLNCGQIQGTWPLPISRFEMDIEKDDDWDGDDPEEEGGDDEE